jgi:6,7-dimethyl-8-ribityllumazine synthase
VTVFEGHLGGQGLRVAVAASRFNDVVVSRLVEGALDGLRRHGAASVDIAWAPGAFELPLVASRLASSGEYDAVIALGAVIRGETDHYELVASQCAAGLQRVQLDTGVPVVFEVLATDSLEQAIERAGGKAGNKGYEAAMVAIEMANLLASLPKRSS